MFKRTIRSSFVCIVFTICFFALVSNGFASVFINEIHYDNISTDTGEAIEIFGPAGSDMSNWALELYNGNGGGLYDAISLSGSIPNQQNGYGTLSFPSAGLQNGAPDGIALVNNGVVVQFLSYEGSFMATSGSATGFLSWAGCRAIC